MGQILFGYADALVTDFDNDMVIIDPYGHDNRTGRVTEFKRIIEEVPHNALKLALIAIQK